MPSGWLKVALVICGVGVSVIGVYQYGKRCCRVIHSPRVLDGVVVPTDATAVGWRIFQVGMGDLCKAMASDAALRLVVKATPVTCAPGARCRAVEAIFSLKASGDSTVAIDVEKLRNELDVEPSNLLFEVSLCRDENGNRGCDGRHRHQALRLRGSYLEALEAGKTLNIRVGQLKSCSNG